MCLSLLHLRWNSTASVFQSSIRRNKKNSRQTNHKERHARKQVYVLKTLSTHVSEGWCAGQTAYYCSVLYCCWQILCVYRLKACGKLNVAGLSAPLLQWHWLTLCVCFWYFSQHFKPFTNKKMMTCWRLKWWLASFNNKVFFNLRGEYYF